MTIFCNIKFLHLLSIFIFLSLLCFSQNEIVVDSLKNQLKNSPEDTNKVNLLNKIGWEHRNSDLTKVMEYSQQAIELAGKLNYIRGKTNSFNNIGNVYYIQGSYPQALKYYLKALETVELLNDQKGIANSLMGLGNIHYAQSNFELAIDYQMRSLKIREALNDMDGISSCYNNLGAIYVSMGKYPLALECQLKALKIKEELGDKKAMSSSLGNIGNIYYELGEYQVALDYQQKALQIRKEMNNLKGMALSFMDIGSIYEKNGKYIEAIKSYQQAIETGNKVGFKIALKTAYAGLSNVYETLNNPHLALKYHKLYVAVKDSIYSVESAEDIAEMQAKFNFQKQEKEIELLKKESQIKELNQQTALNKQKIITYMVIGGLLLVLLMGYLLYTRYRIKQRAHELLEKQNQEIQLQKELIANKNKDITDSILYAKKIQEAILPIKEEIQRDFSESFVIYKPKDIVSGDFYWYARKNGCLILVVADCTGHGVPGAFMSMIGNDQLNQIIIEKGETDPAVILSLLNKTIKSALKQSDANAETRDGMDLIILTFNPQINKVLYAGAYRSLFSINNKEEIIEISADKTSVGGFTDNNYPFQSHELPLAKGDSFYLFTDGFADQFGGESGKKFMSRKFKTLLASVNPNSMEEQNAIIEQTFSDWKGDLDQVDDVCLIGVRF